MKKSSVNWKTVLASVALIGVGGGWAVTNRVTEINASDIKDTKKEVSELEKSVIKQTAIFESQQTMNQAVLEILKKK